jgi:hypothetical protein
MFELAQCPACGKPAAGRSEWPEEQSVRCPHCRAEFLFRSASVEPLPEFVAVAAVDDKTPALPAEPPDDAPAEPEAATPDAGPAADEPATHETPGPAEAQPAGLPRAYATAYDFLPLEKKQQIDTAAAVAARLRGEGKSRSCVGELVKMILGGVAGLVIGYWVLNYFGGARFDWLTVYLPGCPHTYEHWPAEYLRGESVEPQQRHAPQPSEKRDSEGNHALRPSGRATREPSMEPDPTSKAGEPAEPADSTEPAVPDAPTEIPKLPGLDEPPGSESPPPARPPEPSAEPAPREPVPSLPTETTIRPPEQSTNREATNDE